MDGPLHVVAGVWQQGDKFLLALRPDGTERARRWEFPGGKIVPRESGHAALVREWAEELAVTVRSSRPLMNITHAYGDQRIRLHVRRITELIGEPRPQEGQSVALYSLAEMHDIDLTEADRPLLKALALPARYLISTPIGASDRTLFLEKLKQALACGESLIQLRSVSLTGSSLVDFLAEVRVICDEHSALCLWNSGGDPKLASLLDGVHLKSAHARKLSSRPVSSACMLGVSCHSLADLQHAQLIDADFALLSPVKSTRSHPEASSLGFGLFEQWCEQVTIPVFALGGMRQDNLSQAWDAGAQGIAGIGDFW